jgi:hypothetical protein
VEVWLGISVCREGRVALISLYPTYAQASSKPTRYAYAMTGNNALSLERERTISKKAEACADNKKAGGPLWNLLPTSRRWSVGYSQVTRSAGRM